MTLPIAGDVVYDWVVDKGETRFAVGGVGNLCRGLLHYGHDVTLTTVCNPLFAMDKHVPLSGGTIFDETHMDVYIRDYDTETSTRKQDPRPGQLIVRDMFAVVCHKQSCIKRFNAYYADVRDTSVEGECDILRMSSTDDWKSIMEKIKWRTYAIVTDKDHLLVFCHNPTSPNGYEKMTYLFDPIDEVKDEVGAGDCFNVGFLKTALRSEGMIYSVWFNKALRNGVREAQRKIAKAGVFFE